MGSQVELIQVEMESPQIRINVQVDMYTMDVFKIPASARLRENEPTTTRGKKEGQEKKNWIALRCSVGDVRVFVSVSVSLALEIHVTSYRMHG